MCTRRKRVAFVVCPRVLYPSDGSRSYRTELYWNIMTIDTSLNNQKSGFRRVTGFLSLICDFSSDLCMVSYNGIQLISIMIQDVSGNAMQSPSHQVYWNHDALDIMRFVSASLHANHIFLCLNILAQ
ncbi:uncharacterized protein BJ212DRAFT_1336262 [Suillus subaureus]|uniref:Uncharacterized protein n=1 Tax=Suillus subaureus TaxID=48587 RepID=A0A9P7JGK0_9AGAM|nr:uncharacterized protein BJ212DRAFT_1336262 [Suillus subaureus]KAG1820904.1 hypothetical protein BJ212DRAFT_1336262 [Suillus subaureus]